MKILAGNWKMYKNPKEAITFLDEFTAMFSTRPAHEILFFAPALCLGELYKKALPAGFSIGAQNCHFEKEGAFTGENSPQVLAQMGIKNVLLGHSERRSLFGESDEIIQKKLQTAQSLDLKPMLCIGETLSEREAGKTNSVLERQMNILKAADRSKPMSVAYEPVWAIGTGRVAEPKQVEEAHQFIHGWLKTNFVDLPVLYGGSVKADNARMLEKTPGVDGFLVGGASLKPQSFFEISG